MESASTIRCIITLHDVRCHYEKQWFVLILILLDVLSVIAKVLISSACRGRHTSFALCMLKSKNSQNKNICWNITVRLHCVVNTKTCLALYTFSNASDKRNLLSHAAVKIGIAISCSVRLSDCRYKLEPQFVWINLFLYSIVMENILLFCSCNTILNYCFRSLQRNNIISIDYGRSRRQILIIYIYKFIYIFKDNLLRFS